MSEYGERDIVAQGEHYTRHVAAMTEEGLHSKAEIAAEFAHRDIEIERLTSKLVSAENRLFSYSAILGGYLDLLIEAQRVLIPVGPIEAVPIAAKMTAQKMIEAEAKLGEAVKLFERIQRFVGQEVDGADTIDLNEVEIAIDKWCAGIRDE